MPRTAGGKIRQVAGTVVYDWPRFFWAVRPGGSRRRTASWIMMRNRNDRLAVNPEGPGVRCDWQYSRPLHLCNVFPSAGRRLMRTALRDWPIRFRDRPEEMDAGRPEVSFILGHRGLARLPHLLLTLQSIAVQECVPWECIVVEQDTTPRIRDRLPPWVRYLLARPPDAAMPYCRSWAFNVGVRVARSPLVILHDNDLLVPAAYAAEHVRWWKKGFDVINLKRFLFYLDASSTAEAAREVTQCLEFGGVEMVLENSAGGGSVAIGRNAYEEIGGFDEDFIGWGGEDLEFWDRCLTRRVYQFAYLPLVHLWHEAQPGKRAVGGNGLFTAALTERRRAIPPAKRIAELSERPWGQPASLSGRHAATFS
jgi:hypothetical protein